MFLKRTALFSLKAADINTKYLFVKGVSGILYYAPRYSLAY
jgi:hypothetical protein